MTAIPIALTNQVYYSARSNVKIEPQTTTFQTTTILDQSNASVILLSYTAFNFSRKQVYLLQHIEVGVKVLPRTGAPLLLESHHEHVGRQFADARGLHEGARTGLEAEPVHCGQERFDFAVSQPLLAQLVVQRLLPIRNIDLEHGKIITLKSKEE